MSGKCKPKINPNKSKMCARKHIQPTSSRVQYKKPCRLCCTLCCTLPGNHSDALVRCSTRCSISYGLSRAAPTRKPLVGCSTRCTEGFLWCSTRCSIHILQGFCCTAAPSTVYWHFQNSIRDHDIGLISCFGTKECLVQYVKHRTKLSYVTTDSGKHLK